MITDPIFYRLFRTNPETFFLLLGMDLAAAQAAAARYDYQAIEFKETAHRADGVFRPKEPGLPLYFLEVQFYPLDTVFADLLVKAYTYLKQNNPAQEFRGVVLFADRSLLPKERDPYRAVLDAGLIQCLYLDELREEANAPFGLSILYLIRKEPRAAALAARQLIARARQEIRDDSLRANLVELIETLILYKLPKSSREEIQAMLQVHDIRETKVYQEAIEEGIQKGREEGREEGKQEGLQEGIVHERRRAIAQFSLHLHEPYTMSP